MYTVVNRKRRKLDERKHILRKILQTRDHKKITLAKAIHLTAIIRDITFCDQSKQVAISKSNEAWVEHMKSMRAYISAVLQQRIPHDIADKIASFL